MAFEPGTVADELLAAIAGSRLVSPFTGRSEGLTVAQAYEVTRALRERRLAKGERLVGRKIGFTNRGIWDEYGVYQPIWGDMWDTTVRDVLPGERVAIGHVPHPRLEPEIVLGVAGALEPGMDEGAIAARIGWIAHGYEIVQCVFPDWKFAAADSIALGGLHAMLLIGPRIPVEGSEGAALLAALPALRLTLFKDGAEVDRGVGSNALDGPVNALRHLVEAVAADGHPPVQAGEIVTTGTLTRALPIKPGEPWSTLIEGIGLVGMDVQFE